MVHCAGPRGGRVVRLPELSARWLGALQRPDPTICNAEDPQSRRELAISDLHVVRDLVKHLTFPTSDAGWDAARALLLLDELGMLETTSLGTATARQQRAEAAAEPIAVILRRHREMSVCRPGADPGGTSFPPALLPVTGEAGRVVARPGLAVIGDVPAMVPSGLPSYFAARWWQASVSEARPMGDEDPEVMVVNAWLRRVASS
jgi:hypothetical protein